MASNINTHLIICVLLYGPTRTRKIISGALLLMTDKQHNHAQTQRQTGDLMDYSKGKDLHRILGLRKKNKKKTNQLCGMCEVAKQPRQKNKVTKFD